jgi:hypothetical protein
MNHFENIREGEDNRNDEDDGGVRRIVLADTADKSAHRKHWSSFRRPDSLDDFSSLYQAAADYLRKYPRSGIASPMSLQAFLRTALAPPVLHQPNS